MYSTRAKTAVLAKKILEVIPPSMARLKVELRSAAPAGITAPQFRVLAAIFRGMNLVGEIARQQGVSQPAMSKMVEALVRQDLVSRDSRGKDRRQMPLKLTARGRRVYEQAWESVHSKLGRRIELLTDRDRQELERGLDQLERFLGLLSVREDEK